MRKQKVYFRFLPAGGIWSKYLTEKTCRCPTKGGTACYREGIVDVKAQRQNYAQQTTCMLVFQQQLYFQCELDSQQQEKNLNILL